MLSRYIFFSECKLSSLSIDPTVIWVIILHDFLVFFYLALTICCLNRMLPGDLLPIPGLIYINSGQYVDYVGILEDVESKPSMLKLIIVDILDVYDCKTGLL